METSMQNAIEQMKQKEDAGLQYLYSKTYNFVYLRLKSMIRNEEIIRELMQKVYSQAYESAEYLDADKIYEWLGKTVYTLGSQAVRKRKEREASFIEIEEKEIHPDEKVDLKKSAEVINQALDELPELYRATVFAFYYDQLEIEEIAIMMGCSTGVIRNRLNYARKYMIKVLQDYEAERETEGEKEPEAEKEPEPEKVEESEAEEKEPEKTEESEAEEKEPEKAEESEAEEKEPEKAEESEAEEKEPEKAEESEAEEKETEKAEESEAEEKEPEKAEESKAEEKEPEKAEESEAEEKEPEKAEESKAEEKEPEKTEESAEVKEEPKRRFVKPKKEKPAKVIFTVEAFCMAVGKWADENCLGLTIAQKVNRDICQAENLKPGSVYLDGKDFAGAKKTIVPYKRNERTKVENELRHYQKDSKEKARASRGTQKDVFGMEQSVFDEKRFDRRIIVAIVAGLVIVAGAAAAVFWWQKGKEEPKAVVEKPIEKPAEKPTDNKEPEAEIPVDEPEVPTVENPEDKKTADNKQAGNSNSTSDTASATSKPSASKPSTGGSNRPSASKPSTGGSNRPSASKPSTGGSNRPTASKPSTGGSNRPSAGKPSTGGNSRPSAGKPSTGGSNRPTASKPSTGGSNRPSANRPSVKPVHPTFTMNEGDEKYFIFPKSYKERLKESDLRKLSKEELRIARNEIYARYGLKFRRKEMREYFSKQPWYKPKYTSEDFDKKIKLSYTEEKNIALILKIEKELG